MQVHMRISGINSPAACTLSLPLDSGGADDGDHPNWRANSEIEHHIFAYTNVGLWFHICCPARHWIVLGKENRGGWGGGGGFMRD